MLRWYLLALILALILCSKYAPHSAIARSAQDAFDSSVLELSASDDCSPDDEGEHLPASMARRKVRATSAPTAPREGWATGAPTASSEGRHKRKRVTPFISKKVAASQQFKCAMCGKLLQEDWEVDHIVSLQRGGSNDIRNLQALHKRCHAYKNHFEQRGERTDPRHQ
jgi:hypothetical protein